MIQGWIRFTSSIVFTKRDQGGNGHLGRTFTLWPSPGFHGSCPTDGAVNSPKRLPDRPHPGGGVNEQRDGPRCPATPIVVRLEPLRQRHDVCDASHTWMPRSRRRHVRPIG